MLSYIFIFIIVIMIIIMTIKSEKSWNMHKKRADTRGVGKGNNYEETYICRGGHPGANAPIVALRVK